MSFQSTKIALYIHIPFCSKKCSYCDFYSETGNYSIIESVILNIEKQLDYWLDRLNYPNIDTVFIGGGTPSYIPLNLLERLFITISNRIHTPREWTIEANPESITKDFLELCDNYGVTRLSIGVQTFNKDNLETLGRNCSLRSIENGLDIVKKYWNKPFSLDLITSIPGQTLLGAKEDIYKAISYSPEHISYYSLILEDGTPLEDSVSKGFIKDLEEDESALIWLKGRELLLEKGYINYEVSNYTRKNPSYHNINYWELRPYLGVGPGAVSTLVDTNGEIIRIHNKKSIKEFIKGEVVHWGEELEKISPKEFLKDYVIMGFRLKKGIDRIRFKKVFNLDIKDIILNITSTELKNLFNIDSSYISLTEKGYDIMNRVIINLLDVIDKMKIENINWFY